ncbi:hypothetical protein ABH995_002759 [Bradyrhizobium yuanmingense]|uniref:hypothetical protein n=1 Tax=Bradyrhizobium yuanmingense TaxID=108015 RepID=UPI0006859545|nr:hypothetical protein [Bradyrhizobium yuanmingense]
MKATIIREPWIGEILAGRKTWEMRSRPVQTRGLIGLIRKGSGQVVATAILVDSPGPLDAETYAETVHLHGVPLDQQDSVIAQGWVYPWILENVQPLKPPVRYAHKGGVSWVRLDDQVAAMIMGRIGRHASSQAKFDSSTLTASTAGQIAVLAAPHDPSPVPPIVGIPAGMSRRVELTSGNLRHGHVYLRSIIDFFPSDAIGGSNKSGIAAKNLRVTFDPGGTIETDIAGDKGILRARGEILRRFFEDSGASPGDTVEIIRTGPYAYTFTLLPSRGP